jgi:hypothetical protein
VDNARVADPVLKERTNHGGMVRNSGNLGFNATIGSARGVLAAFVVSWGYKTLGKIWRKESIKRCNMPI